MAYDPVMSTISVLTAATRSSISALAHRMIDQRRTAIRRNG